MSGEQEWAQVNPIERFHVWLRQAEASEPNDPNAAALATSTENGEPSVRMILVKRVDERGFCFFTNAESPKGVQLAENPRAALCFHWKTLRDGVQVRIEGTVERLSAQESDVYFATRPRGSQIGAWASSQSRPLEGRFELERKVGETAARFGISTIPRPPHWSGFRLVPRHLEFWQDRPFRLHDRLVYERDGSAWTTERLYP